MDTATVPLDALIRSGAQRLTGFRRRAFIAEVATAVCDASPRKAERRFGWGRDTVAKGLHEAAAGDAMPGELRRAGSPPQRGQGPAARRRHPRHRRAPRLCRSGAQVSPGDTPTCRPPRSAMP